MSRYKPHELDTEDPNAKKVTAWVHIDRHAELNKHLKFEGIDFSKWLRAQIDREVKRYERKEPQAPNH